MVRARLASRFLAVPAIALAGGVGLCLAAGPGLAAGAAGSGSAAQGSGSAAAGSGTTAAGSGFSGVVATHSAVHSGGKTHHRSQAYLLHHGKLLAYGSSGIVYTKPPNSYIPAGQALFAQDCASCHGPKAEGTAFAPNLQGLGPATVDFWVSTGRMPATNPRSVQAPTKPPRLTDKQALEVAAYVNSLDPATPYVPHVKMKGANLAVGASLFALNCAACHTITGAGDALAQDTYAPSLHTNKQPTATQTVEAMRTGPGNMPRFNTGNLNNAQVRDVAAYVVQKIQHPSNPGGWGLGGIGPVAEGFVALLFGVGGLMLVCFWIGDRTKRSKAEAEEADGHEEPGGSGHDSDGVPAVEPATASATGARPGGDA